MNIKQRIRLGFGVILVLLIVVLGLSLTGVGSIVGNADQVIHGHILDANLAQKEVDHLNWAAKVSSLFTDSSVTSLDVQTDDHKCAFGQYLYGDDRKNAETQMTKLAPLFKQIEAPHLKLHESAIEIKKAFSPGQLDEAKRIYSSKTLPALHEVQELLHQIRKEAKANIISDEAMLSSATKTRWSVSITGFIALVTGVIFAFLTCRGIVKILQNIGQQMALASQEVANASNEISASSEALATGASQQAASLEESSSALEEVASMSRNNADNSQKANSEMQKAGQIISEANNTMKRLTESMQEISSASTETQKIVKTIDEIAFQTNLLALNAAVEAARAGEAGAGFAVVADEVRNLAMRAAESARTTSSLIENTVTKVNTGAQFVEETSKAFQTIEAISRNISTLISEISAGSREQTQGVEEINKSVSEIDSVTQQNAATAEESSSATQELTSQANSLKQLVEELLILVGENSQEFARGSSARRGTPSAGSAKKLLRLGQA